MAVLIRGRGFADEERTGPPALPSAASLQKLHDAGFQLIVVSNQTVVSRGLATETEWIN